MPTISRDAGCYTRCVARVLRSFFIAFSLIFVLASCNDTTRSCDCAAAVIGIAIASDAPITKVTLSGPACASGHFRCVPYDADNVIHPPCMEVQAIPAAAGLCHVDVTVGSNTYSYERTMSAIGPSCCGSYFADLTGDGGVSLTTLTSDAATNVDADGATDAAAD